MSSRKASVSDSMAFTKEPLHNKGGHGSAP
jgi:hypothetical protein